jgi:hypothetical protein
MYFVYTYVLCIVAEFLLFFNYHTRRVPDTHLKPDGYGYRYEILPMGTDICMNFYP